MLAIDAGANFCDAMLRWAVIIQISPTMQRKLRPPYRYLVFEEPGVCLNSRPSQL